MAERQAQSSERNTRQDIYLVQTKPSEKKIPKDWTKSGSTKVRNPAAVTNHVC